MDEKPAAAMCGFTPAAGVFHSGQAIAFAPFVAALRKELPDLAVLPEYRGGGNS